MTAIDSARLSATISTSQESRFEPRHRWYTVKEGFSHDLVTLALEIEGCQPGDLIIDPFCGSGTVPVAAVQAGMNAAGSEVNPFLASAAFAKCLVSPSSSVKKWLGNARQGIARGTYSSLVGYSTFSRTRRTRGLFNQVILKAFEGAWRQLESSPEAPRKLLRLALMGAAIDCSNFSRDGKALRYRKSRLEQAYGRDDFDRAFVTRASEIIEDLRNDRPLVTAPWIVVGDSRDDLSDEKFSQFKLCITSPPYLNSFDYTDIYRPELFLGKFVRSTKDLQKIRLRTVRSHVQASWEAPRESDFGRIFTDCHGEISARRNELWDRRIPDMVQAYFEDMRKVLRRLHALAHVKASLWLVVSTSAYAGIEVPVDLILAEVGEQVGWRLREIHVLRRLRSSGQHRRAARNPDTESPLHPLRESLIIFDSRA